MVRYELRETVATCTRPTEVQARQKSQHREGEVDIKSTPTQEAIFNLYLLGEEKSAFSNVGTLSISTRLQGTPNSHTYLANT